MRAFVTGISGFVGRALADLLLTNGWELSGFDLRASEKIPQTWLGNLLDRAALTEALQASQPEVIFHLAGATKAKIARDYFISHVLGTQALFEALVKTGCNPRVVIVSSSSVYGPGPGQRPISEKFPLRPLTDYAASKAAQEIVARRFFLANHIPVMIARTFNLVGPGQSPEFACSAFARQIALAENQAQPGPIRTGNLSARRDFLDLRDAVRAYELLAPKGTPGAVYNVCSGQSVSIRDCLDLLLSLASKPLTTELELNRLQNDDLPTQVGSARLLQRTLGWQPQIALHQSLLDLLNDWRERLNPTKE